VEPPPPGTIPFGPFRTAALAFRLLFAILRDPAARFRVMETAGIEPASAVA
jgi:hypothetical protein